jgi:hypothetical protein
MKKAISYLSAMVLTLAGGQIAFAQEEGETAFSKPDWRKDFSVTIGVKVWVNEWTRDSFPTRSALTSDVIDQLGGSGTIESVFGPSGRPQTQTSEDVEPTPIPQFSVRYKWLVLSGSYYPETEFEFRTTADPLTITQVQDFIGIRTTQTTIFDTTTAEREEWDAGLGIFVLPNVAILGGYKEIDQNVVDVFTIDQIVTDNVFGTTESRGLPAGTSSSEIEIKGPTIGIAGSVPIAHGFGIYASYAHGFMDVDLRDVGDDGTVTEGDADAEYDVAEVGFTYTHGTKEFIPFVPLSAATVYAGYRWQHIETDFSDVPNTEDRTDTTRGFAAGLNLTW